MSIFESRFDQKYGLESSREIINLVIVDVIQGYYLSPQQARKLALYVYEREHRLPIIAGDILVDEAIFVNTIRAANLKKRKTNGRKFINIQGCHVEKFTAWAGDIDAYISTQADISATKRTVRKRLRRGRRRERFRRVGR